MAIFSILEVVGLELFRLARVVLALENEWQLEN
jgi:hypothetical protein